MYPELRKRALAAGADSFVVKGGEGSELVEEIHRTVELTRRCERRR
jgi:DNA-binding NarL/FixJ family response regulator